MSDDHAPGAAASGVLPPASAISEVAIEPPPNRHVWSHVFNILVLIGGTIGLGVMMHQLGWDTARDMFARVGRWSIVIVMLDLIDMVLDAGAISAFLLPASHRISFWRVFAAQAAGRAINIFVPGGVVGEATKVTMLVSCAPKDRVVLSIVLFNLATFYISVAILIVGVPITAYYVDMPHEVAVLVWAGLAIMIGLVIAVGVIVHRGAINTAMATLRGLRIISKERAERWHGKLAELERHLQHLQSGRVPGAKLALGLLISARSVAWITTVVVLHAIGVRLHPTLRRWGCCRSASSSAGCRRSYRSGSGSRTAATTRCSTCSGSGGDTACSYTLVGRARTLAIAGSGSRSWRSRIRRIGPSCDGASVITCAARPRTPA